MLAHRLILEVYSGVDLDFTLLEPGGRLITPIVATADPLIDYATSLDFDLYHYSYIIADPTPGTWEVRIQSSVSAHFTIVGLIDSPVDLRLATNKTSSHSR